MARPKKSFWNGTRVLVTGGAGFIGSNLAKALVDIGSEVVVADNLARGSLANLGDYAERVDLRTIDLTDPRNCVETAKGTDYIFHLASAVGGIQYISRANVENLTPPSIMNLNMLEAARIVDAKHFLFTSSACIYRSRGNVLNRFKETDGFPADPPTTYGWAKVLGEVGCRAYRKDYGLKGSVIRIFNAYGINENFDKGSSHVIPSMIRKAIMYPKENFDIFGDGKQERAFLWIQDLIDALMLAVERTGDAEPINVGSEEVVSISDLASRIVKLSSKRIAVRHDLAGPTGVNQYCADITKATKLLGWKPLISLNDGLRQTYQWAEDALSNPPKSENPSL